MAKVGTIAENNYWKIKIYAPPKEHGPPHVHIKSKQSKAEVKISLETLSVVGQTKFKRKVIKEIIKYIYKNHEILVLHWEALHGKDN